MIKILGYILYFILFCLIGYYIGSNEFLLEVFKYFGVLVIFTATIIGIIYIFKYLNIDKEHRYLHHIHILVFIIDIILVLSIYLGVYFYYLYSNKILIGNITESICLLVLILYLIFKIIFKSYYERNKKKGKNIDYKYNGKQYYKNGNKYYLSLEYISLIKIFKFLYIFILVILIIAMFLIYYIYEIDYIDILKLVINYYMIIPILLYELYTYFDGLIEKDTKVINKKKNKNDKIDFQSLEKEYSNLWDIEILSKYKIINNYESKVIEGLSEYNEVSDSIVNTVTNDKVNKFLYSRILSPIIDGKNIIIESSMLSTFSKVMIPIINIMFTASKRMLFICDDYNTVCECSKWLSKLDIKSNNSNIVVDVLNYDNTISVKLDSKVDIYIGTVDLALSSSSIFENIDVVFGINIDKIISLNAVDLNLLASVINGNRNDLVQYILFSNRVNELSQSVSEIFMKNDFLYQVINPSYLKEVNVNFFKTECGWYQNKILPGFASQYLGQLIPLALPAFKYNGTNVNIVSSNQSSDDQRMILQTTQNLLKKYLNKDIINIDNGVIFSTNENFIDITGDSINIVDDTYNNASLILLNWLKYTNGNMHLNIVSQPYLLRDYIVSNMDFFISNVDSVSNILPVPKTNIKLSVYKIIKQLCYGNVSEETLLRLINSQDMDLKIDMFLDDQVRFVTESLRELVKTAFDCDIFFTSYLVSNKTSTDVYDNKRYYRLLDSILNELPSRLFKTIKFIDSEQSAKILKRIPVFELYQNYLEGQYVTFQEKYYLIDKIDYDNGLVELKYSSNINSIKYRQRRIISDIKHISISKELPVSKVRDSILKKHILLASCTVNTLGYYEFNNTISFIPGEFGYKEIDSSKKGLSRKYNSMNVLAVNISSPNIIKMNDSDKFKLSFTLSVLLNEIFETLFYNIKQYIIVRTVVSDKNIYDHNDELIKLYEPILDTNIDNGINIYITEDTELERGITDSIINNFDSTIIRILYDYLYWILKEDNNLSDNKWYNSLNGDHINISKLDKLSFLKYGSDTVNKNIDLELLFDCLNELIISGNENLTNSRLDFINKRIEEK